MCIKFGYRNNKTDVQIYPPIQPKPTHNPIIFLNNYFIGLYILLYLQLKINDDITGEIITTKMAKIL